MNSWADIEARRETIRAFVEHLHKPENKAERDKCTTDRAYAKELFARLGDFELQKGSESDTTTKIPRKMEFRVYEEKDTKQRDEDLGIIVLPAKLQTPVDVSQVWLCTWVEWTS